MKTTYFSLILLGISVSTSAQFLWEPTNGPTGSSTPFLCSNDHYAFATDDNTLYRSANGEVWEEINAPVSIFTEAGGNTVASLLFNKAYDHAVLKVSTDNGDTWQVEEIPATIQSAAVDIIVTSYAIYLFQYNQDLLYESIDYGKTWMIKDHPAINAYTCYAIEDRLYLENSKELYRSDNQGTNWQNISPNLYEYEYIHDVTSHDHDLVMNTTGHVADTVNGCFTIIGLVRYSYDDGLNWQFYPGIVGNSYNTLCAVNDLVYANSIEGFLRSEDFGATWDTVVTTDYYPGVSTMTSIGDVPLLGSSEKGIVRWDDSSKKLIGSNEGINHAPIFDLCKGENRIWAGCGNGIFFYDLSSKTWSDKMDVLEDAYHGFNLITANDKGWVAAYQPYGTNYGFIQLSEDNGVSWDAIDIPEGSISIRPFIQIVGNYLYYFLDIGALRTSDKGAHWEYVLDDYLNSEIVYSKGKYYVAGYSGLLVSEDQGETWNVMPLPFSIIGLGAYGDQLFASADDDGLYISSNGINWKYAGNGLPDYYWSLDYMPKSLFYRDADNYYAFGYGPDHRAYKTSVRDLQWSEIEVGHHGTDMILDKKNIYIGGSGMYKGTVLNPEDNDVRPDESNDKTVDFVHDPFTGQLVIHKRNSEDSENGVLKIYSVDGQIRYSQKVMMGETIPLKQSLTAGIYFATYQDDEVSEVKSILMK